MPKVRIIGEVDGETREALLKLLSEAGVEVLDDDLPPDAEAECDSVDAATDDLAATQGQSDEDDHGDRSPPPCEEDAGIVVLSPGAVEDGSIETAMRKAAARGCHVIGIWPPGQHEGKLPGAFEDYGGDTIVWDVGRLGDLIKRPENTPKWSQSDDQPRPDRPIKRHKC